jgi:hypothetical protein
MSTQEESAGSWAKSSSQDDVGQGRVMLQERRGQQRRVLVKGRGRGTTGSRRAAVCCRQWRWIAWCRESRMSKRAMGEGCTDGLLMERLANALAARRCRRCGGVVRAGGG